MVLLHDQISHASLWVFNHIMSWHKQVQPWTYVSTIMEKKCWNGFLYTYAICHSVCESFILVSFQYGSTKNVISVVMKHCAWHHCTIWVSVPRTFFQDCRYFAWCLCVSSLAIEVDACKQQFNLSILYVCYFYVSDQP